MRNYTLTGFKDGDGLRRFSFQCLDAERAKSIVIVCADVSLARKYEIRLQELPLICLQLLKGVDPAESAQAFTLTEDRMIEIQLAARDAAAKKARKPPRKPSPAVGQAWRTTPL
jgi:hypothetical protein